MRKQIIGHSLLWALLIGIGLAGYIPVWKDRMLLGAFINYGWILSVFYLTYYSGLKYFRNGRDEVRLTQRWQFWVVIIIPVIYSTGTLVTDKFVLNAYYSPTLLSYYFARFVMICPFIFTSVFLAGFQVFVIEYKKIRRHRNELLVEINYLKEDLDEAREQLNLLHFERVAMHERVIDMNREFARKITHYEKIIRDIRNGDNDLGF